MRNQDHKNNTTILVQDKKKKAVGGVPVTGQQYTGPLPRIRLSWTNQAPIVDKLRNIAEDAVLSWIFRSTTQRFDLP